MYLSPNLAFGEKIISLAAACFLVVYIRMPEDTCRNTRWRNFNNKREVKRSKYNPVEANIFKYSSYNFQFGLVQKNMKYSAKNMEHSAK